MVYFWKPQELKEDGYYPQSTGRFLTKNFYLTPQVLYIFLETSAKTQLNEDDPNHQDHHQEPQEDG